MTNRDRTRGGERARRVWYGTATRASMISIVSVLVGIAGLDGRAAYSQEAPSREYFDVSATNVPQYPELHALDSVFIDVDHDGDLDVVVAVEYGPNRLYLNDGRGRLSWREGAFGTVRHDNEHVRAADFNKDGNMDVVFVASMK